MTISAPLRLCVLFFLATGFSTSIAQQLYIPRNVQPAYDKSTRSMDGKPGSTYWQNFGDYDLKIKFNPKNLLLEGVEYITYYNNSPDTLTELVIRNYADFYKRGVLRDYDVDPKDENDGVKIEKLVVDNLEIDATQNNARFRRESTNMTVKGNVILPGHTSKVEIKWHYSLNKGSPVRTGQMDEGTYFIAYSFPRIAVYDDIDGWDHNKYLGVNESYFDFGNFNAEITVPKNYSVWATGELQNPGDVYTDLIAQRMNEAKKADRMMYVIDSTDLKNKSVTAKNKWNTFKFKADNVLDFTFALSDHYVWQSSSMIVDSITGRKAVVNTVFNKIHTDYFSVHGFSRKTLEVMSFDFPGVAYPYPHITIVDGLDQMEYPMMINDNPTTTREDGITLTDHEIFHMLFPFYMGTNQTKYAWMDEGWATIGEWYISPKIDTGITDYYCLPELKAFSGTDIDIPLIIPSTESKHSYFLNAYAKPALVYLYLKDMLGDDLFRKAMQHYMHNWNGKHPIPWDFFSSINTGSGYDLNWFWQKWFYEFGSIDLAIKKVIRKEKASEIIIEMKGNKPVPIYLTVEFTDGSTKQFHETAMVWKNGAKEISVAINEIKEIKKAEIRNTYVPDINENDNTYILK